MLRLLLAPLALAVLASALTGCRTASSPSGDSSANDLAADSTQAVALMPDTLVGQYRLETFLARIERNVGAAGLAGGGLKTPIGVTLRLRNDESVNLEGHTGVNRFRGILWVGADGRVYRVALTDVGQARSSEERMEVERTYLRLLRTVGEFRIGEDGKLYTYDMQQNPTLRFVRVR